MMYHPDMDQQRLSRYTRISQNTNHGFDQDNNCTDHCRHRHSSICPYQRQYHESNSLYRLCVVSMILMQMTDMSSHEWNKVCHSVFPHRYWGMVCIRFHYRIYSTDKNSA